MTVSKRRKAISPVIATMILSAAVIVVGAIAWGYAMSATSIMTQDYTESVVGDLQYYSERFTIERIYYNNITHQLHIIVYNYGKNQISATKYI
jgi:hypothetical protein